jgi:hypothetical protein
MSIEELKKTQHSKKSGISMPIAVRILESHHERLLRLESLFSLDSSAKCNDECGSACEKSTTCTSDATNFATNPSENDAVSTISVMSAINEVEVEEMQPAPTVIITREPVKDPDGLKLLDELLEKLVAIQDEASLVEAELQSIKQMDEAEQEESEESDIATECTEACQELIDSSDMALVNPCDGCKACIKAKAKQIRKENKRLEKERRKQAKEIKKKQREIMMLEQTELSSKIQSFRTGLMGTGMLTAERKRQLEDELERLTDTIARFEYHP